MSRHVFGLLACALAPMLVVAVVAYADGTYVDSDAYVQGVSPGEYYTTIHTRHDWSINATLHAVNAKSRYYCFVQGETTQMSPFIYNYNLGPGYITGGGDMWTAWDLDPGSHATKGSTYLLSDDKWVVGESNWVLFNVGS